MHTASRMILRGLQQSDYVQYLALINEFRPTSFTESQFQQVLPQIQQSSKIWVLEHEGELIATATVQYETKFIFNICKMAHVEDVCVKESFRKHGLGKKIIHHCVEDARSEGAYKITLDCADNTIPFYRACGFETRGTQMTILLKDPNESR
jgi:glucosamine-phosphate N-acetyltransferase